MPTPGDEVTARYLLPDLDIDVEEDDIREVFAWLGEIENVTLKAAGNDETRINGSLKFAAPTVEIRQEMLNGKHEIRGKRVHVQTWKMQKKQRGGGTANATGANATIAIQPQGGKGPAAPSGFYVPSFAAAAAAQSWGKGSPAAAAAQSWGQGSPVMAGYGMNVCYGKAPAAAKGWGAPSSFFGSSGAGAQGSPKAESAHPPGDKGGDITARYLLIELPEDLEEEELRDYFTLFGELAEVTLKTLNNGSRMGSVKFAQPTMELRAIMLRESHELPGREGQPLKIQTYKMQKEGRPSNTQPPQQQQQQHAKGVKGPGSNAIKGAFMAGQQFAKGGGCGWAMPAMGKGFYNQMLGPYGKG